MLPATEATGGLTTWSLLSDTAMRRLETVNTTREPNMEVMPGAVVFCDISGFTKFIEASNNAEESTVIINKLLSLVVRLAYHCEGDVLKFAGDAVLVLFSGGGEDHAALAFRAVAFGMKLQEIMENYNTTELEMHLGVGVGNVSSLHVGGLANRWEHVVAGPVLAQIRCVDLALAGQVCVSFEVFQHIEQHVEFREVGTEGGYFIINKLDVPIHMAAHSIKDVVFGELTGRTSNMNRDQAALASNYVPKQVVSLLYSGHTEFICEFRRVTVLFVSLHGLEIEHAGQASLARLNDVVNIIFTQLQHFEGTLRQLIIDDKGTVAILCFGLRPAHADDPVRAVQAALNIQREIREGGSGIISSIGVTTGRTYCALVGNTTRAEYACVGSSVNMSARLMGKARGRVLVDEHTYKPCKDRITFLNPEHMMLKGFDTAQRVHCPIDGVPAGGRHLQAPLDNSLSCRMWGREAEFEKVRLWIDATARTGYGGMAVIEADSGMGKSLMLQRLVGHSVGAKIVYAVPSAIQSISPYYICTELFMQVFGIEREPDGNGGSEVFDDTMGSAAMEHTNEEEMRQFGGELEKLRAALRGIVDEMGTEAVSRWPLLNEVFPFRDEIPHSELTSNLHGLARATATRALLVNILEVATAACPLLLVIDNLQCLDTSSWLLLVDVANLVCNVVVLAAANTSVNTRLPDYSTVINEDWVMHVKLNRLRQNEITNIVCEYLQVDHLSPQLERVIVGAAGGNPFFALETAKLFRLRDEISIANSIAQFTSGAPPANAVGPPGASPSVLGFMSRSEAGAVESSSGMVGGAKKPRLAESGRQEILSASLGSVLAGKMDLLNVEEQTTLKVRGWLVGWLVV